MKMPNNYEAVIKAAKEKRQKNNKINRLKPIAAMIVEGWDKLTSTEQLVIKISLKNYDEFIEKLREIVK